LITGASQGLGAEFARQCAERGLNTILVATNADLLQHQADSIKNDYGVEVKIIMLDLSREDILEEITPITDSMEIGLLVNNAGLSKVSPFLNLTLDQLVKQLNINTRTGLILTYHFISINQRISSRWIKTHTICTLVLVSKRPIADSPKEKLLRNMHRMHSRKKFEESRPKIPRKFEISGNLVR
jgi:NAD(P)-dependent dehydrogenase (short-subunit alcohol dehydrogenase family)